MRTRIIGTDIYVFTAWSPIKGIPSRGGYSTITFTDSKWYGRIGTETLEEKEYSLAYNYITSCFYLPAEHCRMSMGEIEIISPRGRLGRKKRGEGVSI